MVWSYLSDEIPKFDRTTDKRNDWGLHGEESGELLAFFCLQTGDFGNLGKFPIFHGIFDTI